MRVRDFVIIIVSMSAILMTFMVYAVAIIFIRVMKDIKVEKDFLIP